MTKRHTYSEFREMVVEGLKNESDGLTWSSLREKQGWDQQRPCYTWLSKVEDDTGLKRERRGNRVFLVLPSK